MGEYRPAEKFDQSKRSKSAFVNDLLARPSPREGKMSWITSLGQNVEDCEDDAALVPRALRQGG